MDASLWALSDCKTRQFSSNAPISKPSSASSLSSKENGGTSRHSSSPLSLLGEASFQSLQPLARAFDPSWLLLFLFLWCCGTDSPPTRTAQGSSVVFGNQNYSRESISHKPLTSTPGNGKTLPLGERVPLLCENKSLQTCVIRSVPVAPLLILCFDSICHPGNIIMYANQHSWPRAVLLSYRWP